ncbi:S8 family serine peptidase [Bosea sp. Tri-49]|uniref:S8 family serine peptidase n=1 Tax=Bosea sp. Tri-49 TaxID=1867715 RepID=UPI003FA4BCDC
MGGAPEVSVLPIRIADWVVRYRTGTMAQGFDYALGRGAHVLSMSMGGLASAVLAEVVNKAYAAGMVRVTAAGNNFSGLPVRSIVYPARMRRVVAACGVMANMRSYSGLDTMEGCYGPASKMRTALSASLPTSRGRRSVARRWLMKTGRVPRQQPHCSQQPRPSGLPNTGVRSIALLAGEKGRPYGRRCFGGPL